MADFSPSDKNGKREFMLTVAERLFARHGFEAVSIRQLVEEAKVNIAMVKYYFGSKDGLFKALIDEKFPRTREQVNELANSSLDPWEKLLATIDIYTEKFFDEHDFHRIIMREMSLSQRPKHVELITEHFAYILGVIHGFIIEGQQKGMFRSVDVGLTLATVFGAFSTLVGQGKLMCIVMQEDCEAQIYSESSRIRFQEHLKELLRVHLLANGVVKG